MDAGEMYSVDPCISASKSYGTSMEDLAFFHSPIAVGYCSLQSVGSEMLVVLIKGESLVLKWCFVSLYSTPRLVKSLFCRTRKVDYVVHQDSEVQNLLLLSLNGMHQMSRDGLVHPVVEVESAPGRNGKTF